MIRILLLGSINDRISRQKAEMIARSPQFQGVLVEHCYAVNLDPEQLRKLAQEEDRFAEYSWWKSAGAQLSPQELQEIIEKKLASFHPDVLLLHTGIVFHRHPETILQVLRQVKIRHSAVKIGYEFRPSVDYLAGSPVFDHDALTQEAETIMFGKSASETAHEYRWLRK